MVNRKEDYVNTDTMHKAFSALEATFKIKNKNYGNSFEKSLDKYGLIAALTRLSDKFNRAEEIILRMQNKDDAFGVDDEPVKDTLLDMANYCIMTSVYISEKVKEKSGDVNG